jgi:hypothetical protein
LEKREKVISKLSLENLTNKEELELEDLTTQYEKLKGVIEDNFRFLTMKISTIQINQYTHILNVIG